MKKTLSLILVIAFMAVPLLGTVGASDDGYRTTHADCEDGQPGLGWEAVPADGNQRTCEGEHWDGQDHYTMGDGNTNGGGLAPCTGFGQGSDYTAVSVLQCADPNHEGSPAIRLARASTGAGESGQYAYVSISIPLVGTAAVFSEDTTAAIYLQDDTNGELLANAVSAARLTRGDASSGDCTYGQYEDAAGWESGSHDPAAENPSACGRDNTAITVVLLP